MSEYDQIVAEYVAGYGHERLARKYHMSHERMRDILIDAGVYQCEEHKKNVNLLRSQAMLTGRRQKAARKRVKPTRAYFTPDGKRVITDNLHDMATLLTYCT